MHRNNHFFFSCSLMIAMVTARELRADQLAVGKNSLLYSATTSAVVQQQSNSTPVSLQRYVNEASEGVSIFQRGRWITVATVPATGSSFQLDSFALGLGMSGVRAVTAAGPTPAFDLSVAPLPCEGNDFDFKVTAVSGPGAMERGHAGTWLVTFTITSCHDLRRIRLSPVGLSNWNYFEGLQNAVYTQNGRSIRQIRISDLKRGESQTVEVAIAGMVAMEASPTLDINTQWVLEYNVSRPSQTHFLTVPITIETK